jgi:predicted SprT family Zn-dependent metalloprotease
VFDLRSAPAGVAVTERSLLGEADQWIRIHPQLLLRYPVRMIQQTVPHEVARLVIDWYLPKVTEPHGPEWMAVMVFFGRQALPFHDMEGLRHARRR